MGASLTIRDPNIMLDCGGPDGCITPRLLDFTAGASTTSYGSYGTDNRWSWNLVTNDAQDQVITDLYDGNTWWVDPDATCIGGSQPCYDINFDTGVLSATIDTTVGASLDINGSLGLRADVWNYNGDGAYGSADFLNTYGMALTPITEGISLDYGGITPASVDLATVPLPASAWLLGSGLIGLIGIARRKKS
jgi:hypothetical protein